MDYEENDISDLELEKIMMEKSRDKKLISAIKNLVLQSNDNELKDFITKNSLLLDLFIDKLSLLSKQEVPNIITTDMSELNGSIKALSDNQNEIISLLSIKPKRLKVVRYNNNSNNTIEYVDIEYTSLSK